MSGKESIFAWFACHYGKTPLPAAREDAMWKFDLTKEEFDYWLQEWRYTRR